MSAKDWAIVVLAATVVVLFLVLGRGPAPEGPPTRSDTLRSELLIRELTERGFAVQAAESHESLLSYVQELEDSTDALSRARGELAREVETLGGELRATAELHAQAETALRLSGRVFSSDDSAASSDGNGPGSADSVTWSYADSTFALEAAYLPPDTLDVRRMGARVSAALAWTVTPDRRLLATAFPSDPRVQLELRDAFYQLPTPPRQECGWWCRRKHEAIGAVIGAGGTLVWTLAR